MQFSFAFVYPARGAWQTPPGSFPPFSFGPPTPRRTLVPVRCAVLLAALLATHVPASALAAQTVPQKAPELRASHPAPDTIYLTRDATRSRTLLANPELAAIRLDTAVARGELRQAATLLRFNPAVEVLGAGGASGVEPGLAQEIEIFGQRGTRITAGRAAVERARFGVADAARRTLGNAERAFYRLFAATRRTALADDVLTRNRRLTDIARRQLQAGEISRLDYNLALVELGRSRARALAARREREQVARELARLTGLPSGTTVIPVLDGAAADTAADTAGEAARATPRDATARGDAGDLPVQRLDVDTLVIAALRRRPDIAEQDAAARQATAEAAVARREALPNLIARVSSQHETGTARALRPGIGLSLPVFNLNRGTVEARRAAARQAQLARAAIAARTRAEVASAVASYETAATEVDVLASTVLEPARQNRRLLETAYREGKVGLPVLLLIRNQVIDAELDYWTAWLAAREALATLAEVTGMNLAPAAPTPTDRPPAMRGAIR